MSFLPEVRVSKVQNKQTLFYRSSLAIGLLAWFAACSEAKAPAPAQQQAEDTSSDFNSATIDSSPTENLSLEDMIKQCGVTKKQLNDPETILMDKQLKGWPKIFVGTKAVPIVGQVNYRIKVVTKIAVKATLGELKQTTDFDVEATPSQALGEAQEKVRPKKGTMKATIATTEERTQMMGESPEWAGLLCTLQPAKEIKSDKGGKQVTTKFTPALPISVSPKADAARYIAELKEGITFNDIEAKVISSTDSTLGKNKELKGTVRITKVPPTLTLNLGTTEAPRQITADVAYKVEVDFEGVANTVALGLQPATTYYISYKKRDFAAIVADTGNPEDGIVVLSDQW